MKHGKKRRGTKNYQKVKPLKKKKIRGKNNKRDRFVRVHSVTDVDFVILTAFAQYKLPRSCCSFFEHAHQHELQNVEIYRAQTFRYECGFVFCFYWRDLDVLIDMPNLKKFEL